MHFLQKKVVDKIDAGLKQLETVVKSDIPADKKDELAKKMKSLIEVKQKIASGEIHIPEFSKIMAGVALILAVIFGILVFLFRQVEKKV